MVMDYKSQYAAVLGRWRVRICYASNMDADNDTDWEVFAALSADPEMEPATAMAASILDDPSPQTDRSSDKAIAWLVGVIFLLVVAYILLNMPF